MQVYPIVNGIYVGIGSPHIAHYVTSWFDVPPYFCLQCCSSSVCHLYKEALVRVPLNPPKHPMAGAQLTPIVLSVEEQRLVTLYNYWCAMLSTPPILAVFLRLDARHSSLQKFAQSTAVWLSGARAASWVHTFSGRSSHQQ